MLLDGYRDLIQEKIESWPDEERFKLKMLLADDWPERRGHRTVLGKQFRQSVREGDFPQITPLEEDGENHEWYLRAPAPARV